MKRVFWRIDKRSIATTITAATWISLLEIVSFNPVLAFEERKSPEKITGVQLVDNKNQPAVCQQQLAGFLEELDNLLGKTNSVYPVLNLIKRYFPLSHCDMDATIELSRRSKYFRLVEDQPKYKNFLFESNPENSSSGFRVQFSILKVSGDSHLPAAMAKF